MAKLFKSKWIITSCEYGEQILENSAFIVDDGKIADIISAEKIKELNEEDFDSVEDFGNSIITPGFINMSANAQYTNIETDENINFLKKVKFLFHNISMFFSMLGVPINTYPMCLAKIYRKYCQFSRQERASAFKKGIETLILNGNTSFALISDKIYYFMILNKLPLKTVFFVDLYSDSIRQSRRIYRRLKSKIKEMKNILSETTFLGIFPHSIWSVHQKLLKVLGGFAKRNNLLFMMELFESEQEKDWVQYGHSDLDYFNNYMGYKKILYPAQKNIIEYLMELKIFRQNVIIQNGNFLTEAELDNLSKMGVGIAFSPKRNEKIFKKSHSFEILRKYFQKRIGFFSNSVEYNSKFNLLEEILSVNSTMPVEELIKYITIYPAKLLKIDKIAGSLEVNKSADFNVFKLDKKYKDVAAIRYKTVPDSVYVNGECMVKDGEVIKL